MSRGWLVGLVLAVGCAATSDPGELGQPDPAQHRQFVPNSGCTPCHQRQVAEYAGSAMDYAAFSPVFNAFESTLEQISGGAIAGDADDPELANFCVGCHTPVGQSQGLVAARDRLAREVMGSVSDHGITCDFCHRAQGELVAGRTLEAEPGLTKFGPFGDPVANDFHRSAAAPAYTESALCGTCHDVRFPAQDVTNDEGFGRIEDLFSEWSSSPWADAEHPQNPMRGQPGIEGLHDAQRAAGEVVSCQDCHMSLYPRRGFRDVIGLDLFEGVDPATLTRKAHKLYPIGKAAVFDGEAPTRRVSVHAFVAASNPMVPFPLDPLLSPLDALTPPPPALYAEGAPLDADLRAAREVSEAFSRTGLEAELQLDAYGGPADALRRRTLMLQAAVDLEVEFQVDQGRLALAAWVENVGAGHNVPAGFSQERELWIELTVHDLGRACSDDAMCEDLVEPRIFVDDPPMDCEVRGPDGALDPTLDGPGSWRTRARRERSGRCDTAQGRCVVYRSGYLIDLDGDGRLNDEPLRHELVQIDPQSFGERCVLEGPDRDWRVNGLDRGLALFTNQLQIVETGPDGAPVVETQAAHLMPGPPPPAPSAADPSVLDQPAEQRRYEWASQRARYEQVRYRAAPRPTPEGLRRGFGLATINPLEANRFFNGAALRPFEPRVARYDLRLPEGVRGPLQIGARLRFRFLPPRLLRAFAKREQTTGLVTEQMIDRYLQIVDMATWSGTVALWEPSP